MLTIRRRQMVIQETFEAAGRRSNLPLIKVAAVVVVANPVLDGYIENLEPMITASVALGAEMAAMLTKAIAAEAIQSYGKGGIVGYSGEQEHANALLTTAFADPIRDAIGGANAWISSMTKIGGPGTPIDIPMNHKHDVYVRSHYDGMSVTLADAPLPDEIALVFCVANRGRLNARVGGLSHDEAMARLA
jgi:hypothetical protein